MLAKMMTLTPAAARPESDEAQRILGFFMGSLANKQLLKPVALVSAQYLSSSTRAHATRPLPNAHLPPRPLPACVRRTRC